MSNSRECMKVNAEALQLHAVYKSHTFYYKSHDNPYQVLQFTQESVRGILQVTRSVFEHAMKSKVRMIKLLSP